MIALRSWARPGNWFPSLSVTDRIVDIAESLIVQQIVPKKAVEDAFHISVATVHGIDLLLTWNFKYIANPIIQADISDYLAGVGLSLPFICTPEELLGEDDAAAQFGFDVRRIFEDIKRSEAQSEAEGWQHVKPPASPIPHSSLQRTRFARR